MLRRCLPVPTVQFSRVMLHLASFTVEPVFFFDKILLNQLIGKDCQEKFKPEDSQQGTMRILLRSRLEIIKWLLCQRRDCTMDSEKDNRRGTFPYPYMAFPGTCSKQHQNI